jgi:protein TonB
VIPVLRLSSFVVASLGVHAVALLASGARPSERTVARSDADAVEMDVAGMTELVDPTADPVATEGPTDKVAESPSALPRDPMVVRHVPARPAGAVLARVQDTTSSNDGDGTPRFTLAVAATETGAQVVSSALDARFLDDAPLPEASVDRGAQLAFGVQPSYPAQARDEGIEGAVGLELVVAATGAVESARIVRGVGHGLDDAALAAVSQFHFTPATKGGRPVRVRMAWSVAFRFED